MYFNLSLGYSKIVLSSKRHYEIKRTKFCNVDDAKWPGFCHQSKKKLAVLLKMTLKGGS